MRNVSSVGTSSIWNTLSSPSSCTNVWERFSKVMETRPLLFLDLPAIMSTTSRVGTSSIWNTLSSPSSCTSVCERFSKVMENRPSSVPTNSICMLNTTNGKKYNFRDVIQYDQNFLKCFEMCFPILLYRAEFQKFPEIGNFLKNHIHAISSYNILGSRLVNAGIFLFACYMTWPSTILCSVK